MNFVSNYGDGPIQFSSTDDALYKRHLFCDNIIDSKKTSLREQFEAVARSIRDVISQRWILAEKTYVDTHGWAKKAIVNVASSCKFSSALSRSMRRRFVKLSHVLCRSDTGMTNTQHDWLRIPS